MLAVAVACSWLALVGAGVPPAGCAAERPDSEIAGETDTSQDDALEEEAAVTSLLQVHRGAHALGARSLGGAAGAKPCRKKARETKGHVKACPFLGESVLVTGGTQGIGYQTALAFIELGASRVHLVGRSASKGEAARQSLVEFARKHERSPCRAGNTNGADLVLFHALDVGATSGDTSAISQLLASPAFRSDMCTSPLKYAVNSAGIGGIAAPTYTLTPALLSNTYTTNAYHTNLMGNLWSMSAEWAFFRDVAKECGVADFSIVALSSVEGIRACPGCSVYSSTKFAINGLVESIAFEARSDNIVTRANGENVTMNLRVNSVLPGLVNTPLTWNQARGDIGLESWQCCSGAYRDATVAECGDALNNGQATVVNATLLCSDSHECKCPNVASDDPEIEKAFPADLITYMLDPYQVAAAIASLSDNERSAGISATELTVDNGDHAGLPG